ncbi:MAG: class II aldolase/adducin family protein [Sphaerochaeta sp.]|nr:class II aldolase/adducin family protein [Sphaerochaeta sp.]
MYSCFVDSTLLPGNEGKSDCLVLDFTTYLLANHGMLGCGPSLSKAVFAAEEFEESAKLWYLGQTLPIRYLKQEEMEALKAKR